MNRPELATRTRQQAPSSSLRQRIVDEALQAARDSAGRPYTVNGRTTAGFDCSGFVSYVLQKVFPSYLHLNTDAIASSSLYSRVVGVPQPGDLVFFPKGLNPYDNTSCPNHVGIVIDSATWIGSQSSTGVAKVMFSNRWWSSRTKYFLRYSSLA